MISTIGSTRVHSAKNLKGPLPDGWVYVGRVHSRFPTGSQWGNQFKISRVGMMAGPMYARLLLKAHHTDDLGILTEIHSHRGTSLQNVLEALLKGRDLVCHCVGSGHRCHAECLAFGAEGDWLELVRATQLTWWTTTPPAVAAQGSLDLGWKP